MKTMKRFAGLLLALVMILTMTVTASAADQKGSITITNPKADKTYTAYKIFDVTYSGTDTNKSYAYSIHKDSEWFDDIATITKDASGNETVTSKFTGLTLKKAGDGVNYIVTTDNSFSAAQFSNTLKKKLTGKTGKTLTAATEKINGVDTAVVKADNLELGYYLVDSTGGLCNLTTTDPNVQIQEKNDVVFDKTDNKESVDVGETVTYTITGELPDPAGFDTYVYKIKDEMSSGLTFQKDSIQVFVGQGNTPLDNTDNKYFTTNDVTSQKFTLDINVKKLIEDGYKPDSIILVKYTAKVNANAAGKVEKNKASLTYSNDPTDGTKTTKTPDEEETVYSAKVIIDKRDANNTSIKLKGAQFVLRTRIESSPGVYSVKYYKYDENTKTVSWVADVDQATKVETNEDGAAEFIGLADRAYRLQEVKAPDGYNLLETMEAFTINPKKEDGTLDPTKLIITHQIKNQSGSILPSTGGIGTTLFYILGAILVIGAGVLLINRRRMNADK